MSQKTIEVLDQISALSSALRQGGPDPMDLQGLSDALNEAVGLAAGELSRLQAQTAAPAGQYPSVEILREWWKTATRESSTALDAMLRFAHKCCDWSAAQRENTERVLASMATALNSAERFGAERDEPEGARYIQLSDTLARMLAGLCEQAGGSRAQPAPLCVTCGGMGDSQASDGETYTCWGCRGSGIVQPEPEPDDRVCVICDGGPGNSCACTCGSRLYDRAAQEEQQKCAICKGMGFTEGFGGGHRSTCHVCKPAQAEQITVTREALETLESATMAGNTAIALGYIRILLGAQPSTGGER